MKITHEQKRHYLMTISSANINFSIIIPTYNRPAQLKECLESITHLDYPNDKFEVIVVDDGSKNTPDNIVDSYSDQIDIKLLKQVNAGPAETRNNGAAKANGKYLTFTDDDCELDRNWLTALEIEFCKRDDIFLGGLTINTLTENPYSTAS